MNHPNINQAISLQPAKSKPPISLKPAQSSPNKVPLLKMKPRLGQRVTFRCSIPSHLTYITKYRPKMFSTIELVNLEANKPNFKTIRTICKALKDAKRPLSSLIIRKDNSDSSNLKQLKHLLNNSHHHCKKLVLHYLSSSEEEQTFLQEMTEIAPRFKRYRDLANLDVYLCCPEDLKNYILSHLSQQIKGLRNLKTLNLDISDCQKSEEFSIDYEPNAPIFTFKYPRSLESLSLSLQKSNFPNQKILSTFTTNLSRCNLLKKLHLDCGLYNSETLNIKMLAPLFQKLQNLCIFELKIRFAPHLRSQDGLNFINSFQYMKHLIELDLTIFFSLPGKAPDVFAKSLFKNLASLTNLRSLKLHLVVEKFSSDLDEQNLFLPLSYLINLQTFHLGLQCDRDQDLPGLQSLSRALWSLQNLNDLGLFFLWNKVPLSHISSISKMFKNLTSLQSLALGFHDADLESDVLEHLFKAISHLKLSTFFFNTRLDGSKLKRKKANIWKQDKGFAPFFKALSGFTSLRGLHLNLSVFDFPTEQLLSLALTLEKMNQLRFLSLELPQLPYDPRYQGISSLLSSIKEMSALVSLGLIFKGDKLYDKEVELVVSNIAECSRSIEILKLRFPKNQEFGNRSVLALQNALRNLSSLKNLTLILGRGNNVLNERSVDRFFEALSFPKNLEAVAIELPSEAVPLDEESILRKLAGQWNLKALTVNQTSWLKSVDQYQNYD